MPLRDIAIFLIVFGALPWILRQPYIGILLWSWLGYMNPHRFSWGFAYNFPFSQIVAITTLFSLFVSKEPKRIPVTPATVLWLTFILFISITTLQAINPDASHQLDRVLKIQLVTLLALMTMGSKERLNMLVWVITLSIAFFGIKGGIFTLMTGGAYRVWGPPQSLFEDNNELALALLMTLPLLYYLTMYSGNKWIRRGLLIGMLLVSVSIVGSYSRGAFLAGFCVASFLWLRSGSKIITGTMILLLMPLLFAFMPEQWHERMSTIWNYEKDSSATGRLDAWGMAISLASDRVLGGGFNPWLQQVFDMYAGGAKSRAAHSIYFSVLAEHGWIGLGLYLSILFLTWRTSAWIIRHSRGHGEMKWLNDLAKMVQVSLVAYITGGAFLSLSYFDLYWHLVAIMILGKVILQQHLDESRLASLHPRSRFPSDPPLPAGSR